MERIGDGKARSHFRTREGEGEECLPCRQCEGCGGELYQCHNGEWQHWATLEVPCPIGASDGQEGGML